VRIGFKSHLDIFDIGELHPVLVRVLEYTIDAAEEMNVELEITSVARGGGGVHSTRPIRGLDLVPLDRDVLRMQDLRAAINRTWDYGKENFEVCPEVRHGTAPHCHLQVRNETKRRIRNDEETMVDK